MHALGDHTLENHILENHILENHILENHTLGNHTLENHILENHTLENHILENHTLVASCDARACHACSIADLNHHVPRMGAPHADVSRETRVNSVDEPSQVASAGGHTIAQHDFVASTRAQRRGLGHDAR